MITRSCAGCGVTIRVESLQHRVCGEAYAELLRRREKYANVKPGHQEYVPTNATQRSLHRRTIQKRDKR